MEQEELEADLLEVGEPSNKLDDPLEDLPAVRKSQYTVYSGTPEINMDTLEVSILVSCPDFKVS